MALTKVSRGLLSTSIVDNGNATAITIDANENVGIGNSGVASTRLAVTNSVVGANIETTSSNAGHEGLIVNRQNSDGTAIAINRAGSTVGSIGTIIGYLTVGTGDSGLLFNDADNAIQPWNITSNSSNDATTSLGRSSHRFTDLYLSGGVVFGSTGGAVTSKTLDDYEEGTWTPTDASGAGLTITVNASSYTKIGNLCYIYAYITYPITSSTAFQTLGGLPFVTKSSNTYAQLTVRVVDNTVSENNLTFQTTTNSFVGSIHYGTTPIANVDLSGTSILISGVYATA